jgi:exodeoxyribonuclease V alpha subunit
MNTSDLAIGFAEHIAVWARNRGAAPDALVVLKAAAERVSLATAEGNVCIPLDAIAADFEGRTLAELRDALLASRMAGTPHDEEVLPIVLDDANRLYLRRYFDYECRLAKNLMRRATARAPAPNVKALRARLDQLFAANAKRLGAKPDWQRIAVALAMQRRLTIISGAPGSGKTTTIAALLACALEENPGARIALAAPTGKAAARMLDALRERSASLPPQIRERLPSESHTIHRLLGVTPGHRRWLHHAGNPLPLDVLVVDEASMLDLALAVRLAEAVPESARLILLGDKDQLASVEVGSVFAGLSAKEDSPLADSVVWFTESYRFAADSGIGRLAAHINAGEAERALEWMAQGGDGKVTWIDEPGVEIGAATRNRALAGYGTYIEALRDNLDDKAAIFRAFERFRVLCAVRETPRGINALNKLLGAHLRGALDHPLDPGAPFPWYPGRPVMVMRNDYVLRLFNGDIGICLPGEDGKLMVWFPDSQSGFRSLACNRLPWHEDTCATTVHKAQGSQFDTVLLVLPGEAGKTAVRELLYTAVTRPRTSVTISGSADVFRAACTRATQRHTGLIERMREAVAAPVV